MSSYTPNGINVVSYKPKSDEHYQTHPKSIVIHNKEKKAKEEEIKPSSETERGHWGSRWEFLLSCIGLSVGIGNVWRFPYLAYENGGGAFLLPYFILLMLVGKPLYLLEVAIGQYSQLGPTKIWRLVPIAKGIGVAMFLLNIIVTIYYNVVICYTLFYLFASWTSEVPWGGCYEWWGADNTTCFVRSENRTFLPQCSALKSEGITDYVVGVNCTDIKYQTASEQYWERYVLNIKRDGLTTFGDIGPVKWDLCLCNLLAWIIVFFCLMKGVKSSGKVVYFTATFPFVVLIALVINGALQPGAIEGIKYFFIPRWEELLSVKVWQAAAEQMFYSLGISWGSLIMFGSYNKFNNRVHIDAYIVSSLDFLTSLLAGCAIFSVLGSWSVKLNVPISQVAKSGQGLAFVAYPEAMSGLPAPQLWCSLFFFMLFTLGLDSQFAGLETILTGVYDTFPSLRKWKTLVTLFSCSAFFLMGLPCVTDAGGYVLDIMDTYAGLSVMCIGICEVIAIMWIYGVKQITADFEYMLGFRFSIYWRFCWAVVSPIVLTVILVAGFVLWENPTYGGIAYPFWAHVVGWFLYLIIVIQIPIWGIYVILKFVKNPMKAFRPSSSWGPGDHSDRAGIIPQNKSDVSLDKYAYDNPALDGRKV